MNISAGREAPDGEWLNPWLEKEEADFQPPLIDKPDQGHDRHQIARRIIETDINLSRGIKAALVLDVS